MLLRIKLFLFSVFLISIFSPFLAFGEEKLQEKNEEAVWKSSLGISFVTVSGNASSETLSISGDAERKDKKTKFSINAGTVYGESDGEKTAEYWYGKSKYDEKISQRTYLFGQLNAQGNKLAGYDYRLSAYPGVGYYFIEGNHTGNHTLLGEIGPGYLYEKRIGDDDLSFISGRAYSKYTWNITKNSDFSQDAEYLHDFDEQEDYRVNTNTSLTAKISEMISLKLSVAVQYVNAPPAGNKNTDVFTSTSLVFRF